MLAALLVAARCLFARRILRLVFWPVLGAIVAWGVIAGVFWHAWVRLIQHAVDMPWLASLLGQTATAAIGGAVAWLVALPLVALAVLATALAVVATIGMPAMVEEIAGRYYPAVARRHGGTLRGSTANALSAVALYALLMLLSVPLWFLVPVGGVLLPLLLNGWLNVRLFRYDALSAHASREEYAAVLRRVSGRAFMLGLALAGLQLLMSSTLVLIPAVLFLLPVFSGLAFVHLLLGDLARLRAV
ncbi:MAG TPA: EI24 domain-containing protein [Nevskiaceae bacterium]